MKKVLSIVLSIAMVLCMMPAMAFAGTASAAQANAAYSDTEGLACEGAVNVLSALGVVDGYTDGTYKPEQTVTRAEMAKLIVTALGVDKYATATTSKFTDMGAASWAIPYVEYASNLNIVNGYGYGLFGPNDTVTYEQAVTMIVRALGYTDKCNEMNGSWPAIYVQKATALGLFENVVNGGAAGADRGDVAIMLYNALDVIEVYADQDGQTNHKYGADGLGVTMMDTLNKDGSSQYDVISSQMADTALVNARDYVGAAAKLTFNKNGDVLAVGDIKTTFLTGDVSVDGQTFKVGDKSYELGNAEFVDIDPTSGGKGKSGAMIIVSGKTQSTTASAISAYLDSTVTMAVRVSGITIKEVYSIAQYTSVTDAKVDETDIAQIAANKKLLGKEFSKDDDGNIDYTTFALNGVESLDDIVADNVVYVYTADNSSTGKITRVDVGTKTVTGTIDKIKTKSCTTCGTIVDKVTIDGTTYGAVDPHKYVSENLSNVQPGNVGDTVTVYLGYDGKIYYSKLDEASSGTYAVILSASKNNGNSATASANKVQLLTADGVKVFSTYNKDFLKNIKDGKSLNIYSGNSSTEVDVPSPTGGNEAVNGAVYGTIVKYTLNDSGNITALKVNNANQLTTVAKETSPSGTTITANGLYHNRYFADNAVIFTAKYDSGWVWDADDDEYGTTTLDKVKDSTLAAPAKEYYYDKDSQKIVAIIIDNGATTDDQYGISTANYTGKDLKVLSDLYIGATKLDSTVELDSSSGIPSVADKTSTSAKLLYKIKETTSGKYKLTLVDGSNVAVDASVTTPAAVKDGFLYVNDLPVGAYYDSAIIYIYDKSDKAFSIGTKADLVSDDVKYLAAYKTEVTDTKKANYNLIDYIVVIRD